MAAAVNNITIEQLRELVTQSVDRTLEERKNQERPQNPQNFNSENQPPGSNRHYSQHRHSPRNQNYGYQNNSGSYNNSSPHHRHYNNQYNNNSGPHHNNNTPNYNSYNNNYNYNNNSYQGNSSPRYDDYPQPRYSPRSSNFSPHSHIEGTDSNQQNPNQNHNRGYRRPFHEVKPLKIMITYVETACTFWGQVLTPDLLDATRQLETDLQEMCPGLPPVSHINKGGLYGTMWCERWYRCVTCQQPNDRGETEVLFVDYGNKEKKNVADLVILKSPKLVDVPFFAFPFRFPKLEAIPEKFIDAVKSFDTESILTGFVSQTPYPDAHTDIYLNRASTTDHPNCTTYNELMVELGFAKKSEESAEVRRPQPSYYTQALQQKVRHLHRMCWEKEQEIVRLNGGVVRESRSPYEDIRYPSSTGVNGGPTTSVSNKGHVENGDTSVSNKGHVENGDTNGDLNGDAESSITEEGTLETLKRTVSPSHVGVRLEKDDATSKVSQQIQTLHEDAASETSFLTPSIEEEIQNYMLSLVDKISSYNSTAAQIISSTDTATVRSKLEQIDSAGVDQQLVELRSCVETELQNLAASTALIQGCADPAALQRAVEARDENLLAVSQAVEKYVGQIEVTDLQSKYEVISEIVTSFKLSSETSDSDQSLSVDSLLDEIEAMGGSFANDISSVHENCADHLRELNRQLLSCSRIFDGDTIIRNLCKESEIVKLGTSETEKLSDLSAERNNIASLGETLKSVCALLEELYTTSKLHSNSLSPLSGRIESLLKKRAAEKKEEIRVYVSSKEDYEKKALSARAALENKPDLSGLTDIKKQLKLAKREVKLAQIADDDEEENNDAMLMSMKNLHQLYQQEESQLKSLLDLAETTHPELMIQHPQLKVMSKGVDLLKTSWELHEFVLPDTAACINSQGLNVYTGFYNDTDPVYFVERSLQTVEGSLEDHAVEMIRETLPEKCIAVILNKRSLRVYGATTEPPV